MIIKTSCKIDWSILIIIFIGIVYVMFPSINNTNDSYMYASDVREGIDLFYPHHLLYNAFNYLWTQLFNINDTLKFLCFSNSIFAVGCLLCFRKILLKQLSQLDISYYILLVGSYWGFMRYATDSETYIIPLFFSLLASCYYLYKKSFFITSLLAGIACLFHQIHFFWWLGLGLLAFYESDRLKNILLYIGGGLIVPITYIFVYLICNPMPECDSIIQFILHDYYFVDDVGFFLDKALLLTPVSFIRTYFQVHGYIPSLLFSYPVYGLGLLMILASFILFFKYKYYKDNIYSLKSVDKHTLNFAKCHGFIFIFQLFFAFLSNGNAEFMIMLPFALAIYLLFRYKISVNVVKFLSVCLFLWNFTLAILPYHYVDLYPYKQVEKYIVEHPENRFVVSNYAQLYNMLRYDFPGKNFHLSEDISDVESDYYTDLFNNKASLSRSSIINLNKINNNKSEIKDTLSYDLGKWIITYVKK